MENFMEIVLVYLTKNKKRSFWKINTYFKRKLKRFINSLKKRDARLRKIQNFTKYLFFLERKGSFCEINSYFIKNREI